MIFRVPFESLCFARCMNYLQMGWSDFWDLLQNKLGSGGAGGAYRWQSPPDTVRWHLRISSEVPFYFGMYLTFSWVWSLEIKSWNYGSKSGLWIGVKPSLGWLIGTWACLHTQIISWKGRPTLAFRIAWDFGKSDIQRTVQKAQERNPVSLKTGTKAM